MNGPKEAGAYEEHLLAECVLARPGQDMAGGSY
jgi:hypothetical protein